MKLIKVEPNSPEWFALRPKKITGSKLKGIVNAKVANKTDIIEKLEDNGLAFIKDFTLDELNGLLTNDDKESFIRNAPKKKAFYQLIADHLAIPGIEGENDRDRGHRLQGPALDKFAEVTGKRIVKDPGLCVREDNENIAISPDALVLEDSEIEKFTEGVEAKCLDDANTVEAYLTKKVPSEYWEQVIQYFVVGDELKIVSLVCYSETLSAMNFVIVEVKREDVLEDIEYYKNYETVILKEVDEIIKEHTF